MNLQSLIEQLLNESATLTKGSQRVMNDKNLVVNLADAIRDDARSHPSAFPAGFNRTSQKAPDQQLDEWFLENIDNIEREGYDGIVYSRDGVNSDWIVRRYIAGSHNWEDITGVMNMNLCDWYLLKNRGMLDPNHKDLPKFNSVRDVGYYMTTHYKDKLEKLRDASKAAVMNKMAKSIKLVDNNDYRIYTTLNRRAGCALGLGTQWCTANSTYGGHFHTYSSKAMLFQLFPYTKEKDKEGNLVNVKDETGKMEMSEVEKYQFDAGGPNFMDITDHPAKAAVIREKFPYLFTDLAAALKEKKPAMEKAFADLSADPALQHEDFKIKTYEIDEEIKKLHKFVDKGYFTDEVRKKAKVEKDDSGQDQPQIGPPVEQFPAQERPQMESIKELARMMIEGTLTEFAPATPPNQPPKLPPKEPEDHWGDEDDEGEAHPRNYHYLTLSQIKVIEHMYNSIGDSDPVYGITDKDEIRDAKEQYNNIPKLIRLADIFETAGVGAGLKFYLTLPQNMKESLWYSWDGHGLNVEQDCKKFGLNYDLNLDEDDMEDTDIAPPSEIGGGAGGDLGSMGATGPTGGGKYPPGTAPSMPESANHKGTGIMENVDKDVAAMLNSLKRYDMLTRSLVPPNYIREQRDIDRPGGSKPTDPSMKPVAAAPAAAPVPPATPPIAGGTGDTRGASTSTSTGGATAHRNTGAATGGAVTITISGSSRTDTSTTTETSTETSTATDSKSAGKGTMGEGKTGKGASRAADVSATGRTGEDRPNVFNITVNSTGQSGNAVDGEGDSDPGEDEQMDQVEQQNRQDDRNDKAELRAGTTTSPQFMSGGPTGNGQPGNSRQPQNHRASMNQQVKQGNPQMENVDKDVAAMLASLKKYDILKESVAPVMGMVTLGEKKDEKAGKKTSGQNSPLTYGDENVEKEKVEEGDNPWEKLGAEKEEKDKKPGEKTKTHKGGEVTKTEKGLVHKGNYGNGDDKKDKVDESADVADPEILEWMGRFAKLGNMKGYGR